MASAQRVAVSGRVQRGAGGAPLAGAWAILHEIGMRGRGGPIDSVRTGANGRYTLTIARADTSAVYVVSSWFSGIAYFSEAVPLRGRGSVELQPILVYDSSSTGPPIRVERRLVTVALPKKDDGTRAALELLELRNPAQATRVTNDTTHPTWTGALPHGVVQFQAGQGDVSGEAVGLRGDSVVVFGPIPPGDPKQLSYSYTLPATVTRLEVPIDQPTGELDLLVEDTAAVVSTPSLEFDGVQPVDQRRFASYRAPTPAVGTRVVITFPHGRFSAQALVPYAIAVLASVLVVGLVIALRKPAPDA